MIEIAQLLFFLFSGPLFVFSHCFLFCFVASFSPWHAHAHAHAHPALICGRRYVASASPICRAEHHGRRRGGGLLPEPEGGRNGARAEGKELMLATPTPYYSSQFFFLHPNSWWRSPFPSFSLSFLHRSALALGHVVVLVWFWLMNSHWGGGLPKWKG